MARLKCNNGHTYRDIVKVARKDGKIGLKQYKECIYCGKILDNGKK